MSETRQERMIEEFGRRYQEFLEKCNRHEYTEHWSKKEKGELDAYLGSDIASVAIRLMASDGRYTGKEMLQVNKMLGTDYKTSDMEDIYEMYGERIDHVVECEIPDNYNFVKGFDEELAEEYISLILMIGEIVMDSDGEVAEEEAAIITKLSKCGSE